MACVSSGKLEVALDDRSRDVFAAGGVMMLPPGHDASCVGGEPGVFVEFSAGTCHYRERPRPKPVRGLRSSGWHRHAAPVAIGGATTCSCRHRRLRPWRATCDALPVVQKGFLGLTDKAVEAEAGQRPIEEVATEMTPLRRSFALVVIANWALFGALILDMVLKPF